MDLTERETELFNLMKSKKIITLDEISGVDLTKVRDLPKRRKQIELTKRNACIGRMKYLGAKLAPHGWIIERVSKIGRGNKAEYSMRKKF